MPVYAVMILGLRVTQRSVIYMYTVYRNIYDKFMNSNAKVFNPLWHLKKLIHETIRNINIHSIWSSDVQNSFKALLIWRTLIYLIHRSLCMLRLLLALAATAVVMTSAGSDAVLDVDEMDQLADDRGVQSLKITVFMVLFSSC